MLYNIHLCILCTWRLIRRQRPTAYGISQTIHQEPTIFAVQSITKDTFRNLGRYVAKRRAGLHWPSKISNNAVESLAFSLQYFQSNISFTLRHGDRNWSPRTSSDHPENESKNLIWNFDYYYHTTWCHIPETFLQIRFWTSSLAPAQSVFVPLRRYQNENCLNRLHKMWHWPVILKCIDALQFCLKLDKIRDPSFANYICFWAHLERNS